MKRRILSISLTLVMLLSFSLISTMPAQAATINVPAQYPTIQAAVNAASPGDTIIVAAGTYEEQIDIGKNLVIQGAGQGNTIIKSPVLLSLKFSTPSPNKPIVYVHNGAQVTIQSLTVDGAGRGNGNVRFEGIAFYNAGGVVQDITITMVRETPISGAQHGVGLYAFSNDNILRNLTISNNTVSDYQKNGMALSGQGLSVSVKGNTITGSMPTPAIAQNGIQVSYGATGVVHRNKVDNNWYTGSGWTSSGILVFESDGVSVEGNNVVGSQTGISVETWDWILPSASNNKIVNNSVNGAKWGISVVAHAWLYSTGNPVADNNKVVNNSVIATNGDTGIFVGAATDPPTPYTASADNNKVNSNSISGYTTPIDTAGGTRSKVHANKFD